LASAAELAKKLVGIDGKCEDITVAAELLVLVQLRDWSRELDGLLATNRTIFFLGGAETGSSLVSTNVTGTKVVLCVSGSNAVDVEPPSISIGQSAAGSSEISEI